MSGGLRGWDEEVLNMHVPGEQLIAEGIDGGSREGALRLAGPACTSETRRQEKELRVQHGWRITVGLFAAQSNAMAAGFVSWTDEPNSEHVDALAWEARISRGAFVVRSTVRRPSYSHLVGWRRSQCGGQSQTGSGGDPDRS